MCFYTVLSNAQRMQGLPLLKLFASLRVPDRLIQTNNGEPQKVCEQQGQSNGLVERDCGGDRAGRPTRGHMK